MEKITNARDFTKDPSAEGRASRLAYLGEIGIDSALLREAPLSDRSVRSNVENYIGAVTIPVGLAGPLLFRDGESLRTLHAPIATTEGALVASICRGAKVISMSGGFEAMVHHQRMQRVPMFSFRRMSAAAAFADFARNSFDALKAESKKYSKHAELVEVSTNVVAKEVHVGLHFRTGDASGQNMTTTCTWHACLWLQENYRPTDPAMAIEEFILEGNGSSDKKITGASISSGRGVSVTAEAILREEAIRKVLKTNSADLVRWLNRGRPSAALDGMVGYNLNVVNVIAGIFAATGQDIACVHESAVGALIVESHPEGLYVAVKLPRLVVGTVGGGTGLPLQKKMLEIAGCAGAGKVEEFAKLIAGFCLSLELSTLSAIVNGQFAIAHELLGRNRPVKKLSGEEVHGIVRKEVLGEGFGRLRFMRHLSEENGILTKISQSTTAKNVGFSLWETYEGDTHRQFVIKSKARDRDLLSAMVKLTGLINPALAKEFLLYQDESEFRQCELREIEIYRRLSVAGFPAIPRFYGSFSDDPSESYWIAQEYLAREGVLVMNAEAAPADWKPDAVRAAIDAATEAQILLSADRPTTVFEQSKAAVYRFARESLRTLRDEDETSPAVLDLVETCLAHFEAAADLPNLKAVVHNDFNMRNVALTRDGNIKIYDWELVTIQYPARDLLEFVLFLTPELLLDAYRENRERMKSKWRSAGKEFTDVEWAASERTAFCHFVLTRLSLYLLGRSFTDYSFLDRVNRNVLTLGRLLFGERTVGEPKC